MPHPSLKSRKRALSRSLKTVTLRQRQSPGIVRGQEERRKGDYYTCISTNLARKQAVPSKLLLMSVRFSQETVSPVGNILNGQPQTGFFLGYIRLGR